MATAAERQQQQWGCSQGCSLSLPLPFCRSFVLQISKMVQQGASAIELVTFALLLSLGSLASSFFIIQFPFLLRQWNGKAGGFVQNDKVNMTLARLQRNEGGGRRLRVWRKYVSVRVGLSLSLNTQAALYSEKQGRLNQTNEID